jgi:hypothetical protein
MGLIGCKVIYEEGLPMRKCTNIFTIYEESLVIYMALNPIPLSFLIYEQNLFYFLSVWDYAFIEHLMSSSRQGFHQAGVGRIPTL